MSDLVQRWIRDDIRALSAYHVPGAKGFVKLDAMENPYHWPDELLEEWTQVLQSAEMNRYPDPTAAGLSAQLRQVMGIPEDAGLMLGNGSDELIQIMAMCTAAPGRKILSADPGFVMYRMIATFCGMEYAGVPLRDDFSLDMPAMRAAIETHQPAIIFLAYPNNPTGNQFAREDIEQIIEAAPGIVVVDEAYHAFADDSFMNDVARYPQLVVMRTVSKMGLAGLRLGFMVGDKALIQEFDKVRLPYNINILTQLSAEFALRHHTVFDAQTRQIRDDRKTLIAALAALDGVQVFPSQANFLLFRLENADATMVFEKLKEHKVLIKNLSGAGGLLSGCLRVTVGSAKENQQFLDALKAILAEGTPA